MTGPVDQTQADIKEMIAALTNAAEITASQVVIIDELYNDVHRAVRALHTALFLLGGVGAGTVGLLLWLIWK
jgi:hypothetical protein